MENNKENPVSFNDYVDTYQKEIQSSIGFIGQDVDFFINLKAEIIIKLAGKYFINAKDIRLLDIGCGIGLTDRTLKKFFKNISGVDVEDRVVEKAKLQNPEINYSVYDSNTLPFENNIMDMAFTINVMHHIVPEKHSVFIKEMSRVVKKEGYIMIFEHNPFNPLTQLAVKRCEFDRDAILIRQNKLANLLESHGLKVEEKSYIVFFPFKSKLFRGIESRISWLPLGAQYFIIAKNR